MHNNYVFKYSNKTVYCGVTKFYLFIATLPAIFIMETIMQHVGEVLGVPPETVKEKNLYQKGQVENIIIPTLNDD